MTPPGVGNSPSPVVGGPRGSAPCGARPGLRPWGLWPPPATPTPTSGPRLTAADISRPARESWRFRGNGGPRGGEGVNARSEENCFYLPIPRSGNKIQVRENHPHAFHIFMWKMNPAKTLEDHSSSLLPAEPGVSSPGPGSLSRLSWVSRSQLPAAPVVRGAVRSLPLSPSPSPSHRAGRSERGGQAGACSLQAQEFAW